MSFLRVRDDRLPSPDLAEVGRSYRARPGKVVVQLAEVKAEKRGLIIPDRTAKRFNANVGVVLAAHPKIRKWQHGLPIYEASELAPGDVVLVHPKDGKTVLGMKFGSYECETDVVFLGCFVQAGGKVLEMPWGESIMAKVVNQRLIATQSNVVLKLSERQKERNGLYLPDSMTFRTDVAEVVSVGPLVHDVIVGEMVLYEKGALQLVHVIVDDVESEFAIIDEAGIHGVMAA